MCPQAGGTGYRWAEDLIVLEGEHGDVLVGNGRAFSPLHVQNGLAFRQLVRSVQERGLESLSQMDDGIFDVLRDQRIIVDDDRVRAMLHGTLSCRGVKDESTAYLPLGPGIDERVWCRGLRYQMEICSENQVLNLRFVGADPGLSWSDVERVLVLVDAERKRQVRHIQIRYHFISSLHILSRPMLDWLGRHDVVLTVSISPEEGSRRPPDQYQSVLENARKVADLGVPLWFVTPCVSGNVGDLVPMAEAFSKTGNVVGCEFPVCMSRMCWGMSVDVDHLPDPDDYTAALLELYEARVIRDDMLIPVRELRHRVSMGGYEPSCSCWHDNTTYLSRDGEVYPCDLSHAASLLCIGNVMDEPEKSLPGMRVEWERICEQRLALCMGCKWRYLCGMACPIESVVFLSEKTQVGRTFLQKYHCQPRVALLEAIVWDIVNEAAPQKGRSPGIS